MAVGMVKPQGGVQADGNPYSISNPRQLSHLTLSPRVGIKGFLKCQVDGQREFPNICNYLHVYCIVFNWDHFFGLQSSWWKCGNVSQPRKFTTVYRKSLTWVTLQRLWSSQATSGARTFRNQEPSKCPWHKRKTHNSSINPKDQNAHWYKLQIQHFSLWLELLQALSNSLVPTPVYWISTKRL